MPVVELRNHVRGVETPSVLMRMKSSASIRKGPAAARQGGSCGSLRASCCKFASRCEKLVASLLLEVLGGMGAIWGCSELFYVRTAETGDAWRGICGIVGLFLFMRWACVHVLRIHASREVEGLSLFVLQFFGGPGAWWGFSDIVGLRHNYPADCHDVGKYGGIGSARWTPGYDDCNDNMTLWRVLADMWLPWFFTWWHREQVLKIFTALNLSVGGENTARYARATVWCVTTFVLEVMGGTAALWSAGELCGPAGHSLRRGWGDRSFGQPSSEIWRYLCAVTFVLCFARWLINANALHKKWRDGLPSINDLATQPKACVDLMFSMRLPNVESAVFIPGDGPQSPIRQDDDGRSSVGACSSAGPTTTSTQCTLPDCSCGSREPPIITLPNGYSQRDGAPVEAIRCDLRV